MTYALDDTTQSMTLSFFIFADGIERLGTHTGKKIDDIYLVLRGRRGQLVAQQLLYQRQFNIRSKLRESLKGIKRLGPLPQRFYWTRGSQS